MSSTEMMFAVLMALGRVACIVMLGRLAARPDRYTWVQGIVIILLAVVVFLPVAFMGSL